MRQGADVVRRPFCRWGCSRRPRCAASGPGRAGRRADTGRPSSFAMRSWARRTSSCSAGFTGERPRVRNAGRRNLQCSPRRKEQAGNGAAPMGVPRPFADRSSPTSPTAAAGFASKRSRSLWSCPTSVDASLNGTRLHAPVAVCVQPQQRARARGGRRPRAPSRKCARRGTRGEGRTTPPQRRGMPGRGSRPRPSLPPACRSRRGGGLRREARRRERSQRSERRGRPVVTRGRGGEVTHCGQGDSTLAQFVALNRHGAVVESKRNSEKTGVMSAAAAPEVRRAHAPLGDSARQRGHPSAQYTTMNHNLCTKHIFVQHHTCCTSKELLGRLSGPSALAFNGASS